MKLEITMSDSVMAALPDGLDETDRNEPGEVSVLDLAELNWDGDGQHRHREGERHKRHDNTRNAGKALTALAATSKPDEPAEQEIRDLLTNMMHLADALELDFTTLVAHATGAYYDEIN